ncbi:putative glutamate receptor [Xylocopa sonorina]|uniref:putative glutamate receptor n=1 Tax=Xylocopa sonorina TaxID=1818115 RepID=UPI00403AC5DE
MARMIYCTIIAFLFLPVSVFLVDLSNAYNYILLIREVRKYYGTSCITIIYSNNHTDFNQTTMAHIWSRAFSREGVLTMIINLPQLSREARMARGCIARRLYVVMLVTNDTMNEFSMTTRQIDVSFPVWLVMFLPHMGDPMRGFCQNPVGNPFNLKFNTEMLVLCYDRPLLEEWYVVGDNRTRVFELATWRSGEGFRLKTTLSLYGRRNNMFGEKMRLSVVEESLFFEVKNGVLLRFLGRVIQELSRSLNFTIELTSFMPAYGSWDKRDQIWTGVIGEVASNRADLGVAEFSMTNHRLNAVDFTLPLFMSHNRIYFKKPDGSIVHWSAYLKTFNVKTWAAIICLIVTTPILLTVIKTRGGFSMNILADNYIYVWGIYCQQGLSVFPSETSLRLAFLAIFVSALIAFSAYSASLISSLTVSTASLPFSTIEGFASYGSYKLIAFKNSADYDAISASDDVVFSKIKKLLKGPQDLPVTTQEAFMQVCNENVGFYVTEAIKDAISTMPCETVYVEAGSIDNLALILNKGNQYTGAVNYYLQRFKDNGVLTRLQKTRVPVITSSHDSGYIVVTLGGIAPILAVLAGGILLGCFVLITEKVCYHLWCNEFDKNRPSGLLYQKKSFHPRT